MVRTDPPTRAPSPLRLIVGATTIVAFIGTSREECMSTRSAIAATSPTDSFIGRGAERERLRQALRHSETGRGQLVLLTGAAGIGKTRLALDIADEATRQARPVLWGRCLEEPGAPPYWPWVQVLRGLPEVPGGPAALGALGLPSVALLAGIVPSLFAQGAAPQRRRTVAPTDRFQLFDAVAQLLHQVARHEPLVLMLEDLHWADTTSLRLLAFVASGMVDSQLFIVGSCRDGELTRAHPLSDTFAELERMPAFSRLPLAGFSTAETGQYLSVTTGCETTAAVASAVQARTEGHPLFLRETLRWVMGSRTRLPTWTEADTAALGRMPPGVRDVIGKRLNGLPPRAVRLLSMAACIGRDFDVRLLSAVDAETDDDEVLLVLAESLAARLVEPTDDLRRLRFSHALVRETLYDDILPMRRVKLHRQIGEWLEATHADAIDAWLPQLAYHFGESADDAGRAARATAYAERAAAQSAQLSAYEEAARFYRLALRLERDCGAPEAGRRCGLLLGLGDALVRMGAGEASLAAWQEAATLAHESGSGAALVRAALGASWGTTLAAHRADQAMTLLTQALQLPGLEANLRVELLARLCRAHVHCDQRAAADATQSQALALATELGDARSLYLALACITTAGYWPERLTARVAAGTQAHAFATADDAIERSALVDLLAHHVCDLLRVGDTPALKRVLDQAMPLAQAAHSAFHEGLLHCMLAVVSINEGRFDDAQTLAAQALLVGRRASEDIAMGAYGMQMFCLRREQGRLNESLPLLRQFVAMTAEAQVWRPGLALLYADLGMDAECRAEAAATFAEALTAVASDARSLGMLAFAAEVCVHLGDAHHADTFYQRLSPYAGSVLLIDHSGPCLGAADRLLGMLATVQARWDVAQQHFETALALDERSGAVVWLAHSRQRYAWMLQRRLEACVAPAARGPMLARAHELLDAAQGAARAFGMGTLLERIAAVRTALAPPPQAYPFGLTSREVQVLQLVAIGRNNRDVATVLDISPNTVANHLRSIFDKTYCANRTEAAAFAIREGLATPRPSPASPQ